jgi:hypothetical protein
MSCGVIQETRLLLILIFLRLTSLMFGLVTFRPSAIAQFRPFKFFELNRNLIVWN